MDEYVKILADFAQRRLGTDLGLRTLDEDPHVGLSRKSERHDSDEDRSGGGGGWGPPLPGLVQQQVDDPQTLIIRIIQPARFPHSGRVASRKRPDFWAKIRIFGPKSGFLGPK